MPRRKGRDSGKRLTWSTARNFIHRHGLTVTRIRYEPDNKYQIPITFHEEDERFERRKLVGLKPGTRLFKPIVGGM